jgi:O-antigen ligase
MTRQIEKFSRDQWTAGSALVGMFLVVVAAMLVVFTRRIELGAIVAMPVGLLLLTNFRLATTITLWVVLIWLLRLPLVFFELLQFSYIVYASVILTMGAYLLRLGIAGKSHLPFITNRWLWLLIATVIFGGVHGARSVESIPPWLLAGSDADLGVPWAYYRTVVFPGVLLPLLAVFIGAAVCDKHDLKAIKTPIWTLMWVIDLLIIGQVAASGEALSVMATQRSEHLTALGFHSNEFGAFLAIAYGLGLGIWDGAEPGRPRKALGALLVVTAVALLLTFSRGAYLAFAVANVVVFMRGAPKKKAAFLVLTAALWFAAPTALVDRVGYGLTSRDANEISAGRVDNLWLPLLPNIADHLWFGQGLQSIMWTDAQIFQEIYPVNHAHNAFIDLLLDVGVIGTFAVLAWYAHVWRGFYRRSSSDPDPEFRTFFFGSHLALLSFFLYALTNSRLTPTAPSCLLWIAGGVLIGRLQQKNDPEGEIVTGSPNQTWWRPLTRARRTPVRTAAFDGV